MNSIIIIFEKTFISTAVEKKKLLIKSRALASRPPFFLRDRKYLCDKLTMGECEVFNEKKPCSVEFSLSCERCLGPY